jgi:hypothetical protein
MSFSSESVTSGQTQNTRSPAASLRRTASTTSARRSSGIARVITGLRPGGFPVSRETSMSP